NPGFAPANANFRPYLGQRSSLHPQSFVQYVFRVAPRRNLVFELLHRPDEAELLLSLQPVHSRYEPRIHVASSAAQKSPYSLVWGPKTARSSELMFIRSIFAARE